MIDLLTEMERVSGIFLTKRKCAWRREGGFQLTGKITHFVLLSHV